MSFFSGAWDHSLCVKKALDIGRGNYIVLVVTRKEILSAHRLLLFSVIRPSPECRNKVVWEGNEANLNAVRELRKF